MHRPYPRMPQKKTALYYIRGITLNHLAAYYFVRVLPKKLPLFLKAIQNAAAIDLKQFGDIVASGYGPASAKTIRRLRKEYVIANL